MAKVIQFQKETSSNVPTHAKHSHHPNSPAEAAMYRENVLIGVAGRLVEVAVVVIRHAIRPANLQNKLAVYMKQLSKKYI